MNHQDKLINKIKTLDLGKPIFNLSITSSNIRMKGTNWNPNLEEKDTYNNLINKYCNRSFNSTDKQYYIDTASMIIKIERVVLRDIVEVFTWCSPAKEPKRTKAYKNFRAIISENRGKIEFVNSIFDIYEYYHQVTITESIKKPNNDVHRKNIYQLLCLMEKSYGKSKTNSNQ